MCVCVVLVGESRGYKCYMPLWLSMSTTKLTAYKSNRSNSISRAKAGFHLDNCSRGGGGGTGGISILKGGGMMVKDVTKIHKCQLGGRGMLECVSVHGFMSLGRGVTPVLT